MPYEKLLTLTSSRHTLSMLILIQNNPGINLSKVRDSVGIRNNKSIQGSRDILLKMKLIRQEFRLPNENLLYLTDRGLKVAEAVATLINLIQ